MGKEEVEKREGGGEEGGEDYKKDSGNYNNEYAYNHDNKKYLCNHPSINSLGLIHLFGMMDLVEVDVPTVKK